MSGLHQPVSDKELAALISTELAQSGNFAGSEWRESIKQSLNYLLMRLKGDEVEGRSQIQSGDVADMLDNVQAEMQPMYAVDELVELGQEGPDDETHQQESEFLNWYFRERCRGFDELDIAVQDGLLSRNGYLKCWFEESFGLPYEHTVEGLEIQVDAEIQQLSQEADVEVIETEIIQEQQIAVVEGIGPDGMPLAIEQEISPALFRVTLKVTPRHKEVKVESVAPEDMFGSRDSNNQNMQQGRFWAQRRRMARMDVAALGFELEQVDKMPQTATFDSDVRIARKSDYNTYLRQAAHQSGQLVYLYECYYRIDRDGDGIPELWKVFYSSNKEVMRWADTGEPAAEMVRVCPFACGSPMKVGHRHEGRSLFDKEQQVEDTKRTLLRQMLDNIYLGNDVGMVLGPSVDIESYEETDTGRAIRAGNVADVAPIPYTNTSGESLAALSYMDKIRRERGGASIDMSVESMPVNQAAHSTERVMSSMEKLVGMYARNFARALVRDTFVLLHQQMQLMPGKMAFESGDGWAEVEPRYWVQRTRISVNLGLTEGERMRRSGSLGRVIEIQNLDAQTSAGVLIDQKSRYAARLDFARNASLPDPEQYWVDPESPEAQQAAQAQSQRADQERQLALAQQNAIIQAQMQVAVMQEQTKRMSDQLDALEAQRDRLAKLTIEMTKIEADTGRDVPFGVLEGDEGQLEVVR